MNCRWGPSWAPLFPVGIVAATLAAGLYFDHSPSLTAVAAQPFAEVDPAAGTASREVISVAHWVVASRDPAGQPFLVVDREHGRIHAFDAQGRLRVSATTPAEAVEGGTAAGTQEIPGEFWSECLASLPAQPNVAYVVPAETPAPANAQQARRPS